MVDDHEAVREGLVSYLSRQADMRVVAETGDPKEIESLLQSTRASILLLDISMEQFNAVKSVMDLKSKFPRLKIMIVTVYDKPQYVLSLIDAGVDGYYLKAEELKALPVAIREVMAGDGWFSQKVGTISTRHQQAKQPYCELTQREIEVLKCCAAGMTTAEFAKSLFIGRRTAQEHVNNILRKLGARTRAEAVTIGIQRGIIDLSV